MEAPLHVISTEIIKPSSETPNHLRTLKLSYLDQLAPPGYVPIVSFYQADESKFDLTSTNHTQVSSKLKQSLSNTLTSFYPLAGRTQDNSFIDCNDAGVDFIEARDHAHLINVINEPKLDHLKKYIAADAIAGGLVGASLVVVKITFFDCGGFAIGVCISHKIADFFSVMAFINAWAAACRGESEVSRFSFDLASFFPARDFPDSDFWPLFTSNEKLITKRFIFDKEKFEALKQAVTSTSSSKSTHVENPTRVEVVSTFIWKSFMEVAKFNNLDGQKNFAAFHAVNLRGRTNPPQLLENIFGNCVMSVMATTAAAEYEGTVDEFHDLVRKLRNAFRSINDDYITKGDNHLNDLFNLVSRLVKGELEWCIFSSWCRFPVYEVDYGWGKPVCFFTSSSPLKNTTILLNSKSGDGIEALVTMPQDNIEWLEAQIKLLSTTTMDNNS